ncbi:MAG: VCBS repeat-containing protein, partial [Bacteroidota bacterium]
MRFLLFFILSLSLLPLEAQVRYAPSQQIPVTDFVGQPQTFAWNGGMNHPLISSLDIDLDGNEDLIFFDRADESFNVYLNQGSGNDYRFAPKFNSHFDSCECSTWTLLEDYNCDGVQDIFCGTQTGLTLVYTATIYGGDSVGFELTYDPIMAQYSQNFIPLAVPKNDIPALIDMDGDGDLDVLTPQNVFSSMAYLQNMAIEDFGRCDTLVFSRETACWGHFFEASADNNLFIRDTLSCPLPSDFDANCLPERFAPNRQDPLSNPRHAGTTLLSLDLNGDGLNDLLLGDISFSNVVATFNQGCLDYAFMDSVEMDFPGTDIPADLQVFPGMFYEDIDNDGVKDLLLASNETLGGGENVRGLLWYRNAGQNDNPDFKIQGRTFIVDEQIDLGILSAPTFFDYDDDDVLDLLVGNGSASYYGDSTVDVRYELRLYRNTGTSASPAYVLADSNFLDLSSQTIPLTNIVPAAGDLDGDGDDDLLLGYQAGKLAYFENTAAPGQPAIYNKITEELADTSNSIIDIGNLSAPELYDFDGDNDLDLFIGEEHGWINYYENTGTPQNFAFTQITDTFGGIKLSNEFGSNFSGNSKPRLADIDRDGAPEMFIGGDQGFLEMYTNLTAGLNAQLVAQPTPFNVDFGSFSAPAIAKIDSSDNYTFVIGSIRGGLQLLQAEQTGNPPLSAGPNPQDKSPLLFPNPTTGQL